MYGVLVLRKTSITRCKTTKSALHHCFTGTVKIGGVGEFVIWRKVLRNRCIRTVRYIGRDLVGDSGP